MTKTELYKQIAVAMLDKGLLEENNHLTTNDLLQDVISVISNKLDNFTIVNGDVVQ